MAVEICTPRRTAEIYITDGCIFDENGEGSKVSEIYLTRKIDEGKNLRYQLLNSAPFPKREEMMGSLNKAIDIYMDARRENFGIEMIKRSTGETQVLNYDHE